MIVLGTRPSWRPCSNVIVWRSTCPVVVQGVVGCVRVVTAESPVAGCCEGLVDRRVPVVRSTDQIDLARTWSPLRGVTELASLTRISLGGIRLRNILVGVVCCIVTELAVVLVVLRPVVRNRLGWCHMRPVAP